MVRIHQVVVMNKCLSIKYLILLGLAWCGVALGVPDAWGAINNFQLAVIAKSSSANGEAWRFGGAGTNLVLLNKPGVSVAYLAGLAYGPDSNLYIACSGFSSYPPAIWRTAGFANDSESLFFSNNLVGPRNIDFAPGGVLYVADYAANAVKWFDASGTLGGSFAFPGVFGLDYGSDGALYLTASHSPTGKVVRYDWGGSAWTQTWAVTSLHSPQSICRQGSSLYYSSFSTAANATSVVVRVDAATGGILSSYVLSNALGVLGMAVASDGSLYLASSGSNVLVRCALDAIGNITNSAVLASASSGMSTPRAMVIIDQEAHAIADVAEPQLWLKADAGVMTNASGQVTNWVDQSVNAYQAVAPSSYEPDYIGAVVNGKPGIRFTMANNDYFQLRGGGTNMIRNIGGATVFTVVRHLAVPTGPETYFNVATGTNATTRLQLEAGSGLVSTEGRKLTLGGRRADTDPYADLEPWFFPSTNVEVVAGVWDWQNTSLTAWRKGGLVMTRADFQTSGACADTGSFAVRIGGQSTNAVPLYPLNADLMELVVYNRALTSAEVVRVQGYLMDKYGIPSGDPEIVSGNVPNPAYQNHALRLWLKADSGVLTNSSAQVTNWQDHSVWSNHVIATAANAPAFVASGLGGKPSILFNRTNGDYMTNATPLAASLLRNVGAATVFVVLRFTAAPLVGEPTFIFGSGTAGGSSRALLSVETGALRTGGRRLDVDAYQFAQGASPGTNALIVVGSWDWASAVMSLRSNGLTAATKDPFQTAGRTENTDSSYGLTVGNFTAGLNAQIAEILVYLGTLSANDENFIGGYLAKKYNVVTHYVLSQGSVFSMR